MHKVISLIAGIKYLASVEPWNNKDLAIRRSVYCAPCYLFTSCLQGYQKRMREIPMTVVIAKCRFVP